MVLLYWCVNLGSGDSGSTREASPMTTRWGLGDFRGPPRKSRDLTLGGCPSLDVEVLVLIRRGRNGGDGNLSSTDDDIDSNVCPSSRNVGEAREIVFAARPT